MTSSKSIQRPWESRLESFTTVTKALVSHYGTTGEPQVRLLSQAVGYLQSFAAEMLTFFYTHFGNGKLSPWDEHPPDNVYSLIMSQVSYDLEVMQRATAQRLSSPPPLLDGLREADQMAADIVERAVAGDLLPNDTRVIAYYQKSPSVRVIPYVNLALIGIPYTVLDEPRDFLATPHEIGHYVFWHGHSEPNPSGGGSYYLYRTLANDALAALKGLMIDADHAAFDEWCYVWLEEMFADVFGCWMSGPIVALTIQDVMRSHSQQEFVTSDNDHPIPLTRPYIHMKALYARGIPEWAKCVELLKDEWNAKAKRNTTKFSVGNGQTVEVTAAVKADYKLDTTKPVDALVDVLLKRLKKFVNLGLADLRDPVVAPADIATLYAQFDGFRKANLLAARATMQQAESRLSGLSFRDFALNRFDWPSADSTDPKEQAKFELKQLLADGNYQPKLAIDQDAWWRLVLARGWTTEGPPEHWP